MKSVLIDSYLCNGCATCVALCPEVFRLDEFSGKAVLVEEKPKVTDKVHEAAAYCPEKCIEIFEQE